MTNAACSPMPSISVKSMPSILFKFARTSNFGVFCRLAVASYRLLRQWLVVGLVLELLHVSLDLGVDYFELLVIITIQLDGLPQ
ncbi:MAG: hypothetical protein R3C05_00800 [Pirellulaceae bacterium]